MKLILKLKPEWADARLVTKGGILETIKIREEDYEMYYKKYDFLFDIVEDPFPNNIVDNDGYIRGTNKKLSSAKTPNQIMDHLKQVSKNGSKTV